MSAGTIGQALKRKNITQKEFDKMLCDKYNLKGTSIGWYWNKIGVRDTDTFKIIRLCLKEQFNIELKTEDGRR